MHTHIIYSLLGEGVRSVLIIIDVQTKCVQIFNNNYMHIDYCIDYVSRVFSTLKLPNYNLVYFNSLIFILLLTRI